MTSKLYYSIFLTTVFIAVLAALNWVILPQSASLLAQGDNLPPLQNVVQVSAGGHHTCALTTEGSIKCWGDNAHGQLGDGTTENRNKPVSVSGLGSDVTAIIAGESHTCALTVAGTVMCWGDNEEGQLGDGTTIQRLIPAVVSGLDSGVIAMSAGSYHTCVLTVSHAIKCWGRNYEGQLGNGTRSAKFTPIDVSGLETEIVAITAGYKHTCALNVVGGVMCWGYNEHGEVGDGTTMEDRLTPVAVKGLNSGVTSLSAGFRHTCALTGAGAKCWGDNRYGQLGDGTTSDSDTPVTVLGLGSSTTVALGEEHTCVLTSAGGVKCWGWNYSGQIGDGTTTALYKIPVDVNGLERDVVAITAGSLHTCALTVNGNVKCWGVNYSGQLGNGTGLNESTPVAVSGLDKGVISLTAGGSLTCALMETSSAKCWGSNDYGQLGDGTNLNRSTPVNVVELDSGVSAITVAHSHSCALTKAGNVKCWGANYTGQLGDGTTENKLTPVNVVGLDNGVAAITVGNDHTCALTMGGGVKCWGANYTGQLGDGTTENKLTPVNVVGLDNGVAALTAGLQHTCALLTSGSVKCWGANYSGQLGDGTTENRLTPVEVVGLDSGVTAIAAGLGHTCVLMMAGTIQCWGDNRTGQLGDGTTENRLVPVRVSGLNSAALVIAIGGNRTCVLTTVGIVHCWGDTPTSVSINEPDAGGIVALAAGWRHTCVLTATGSVKCWGDNYSGQLGDGTAWRTTPVIVVVEGSISTPTVTPTPIITYTDTPTATDTPLPTSTPTATTTPNLLPTPTPTAVTVRVEGKVLDKTTQAGIADVLMTLWGTNTGAMSASVSFTAGSVYTTTTDLHGVFVFPAVIPGAYTLTGTKAGVVIEVPAPVTVSGGQPIHVPVLVATIAQPKLYLPLVVR